MSRVVGIVPLAEELHLASVARAGLWHEGKPVAGTVHAINAGEELGLAFALDQPPSRLVLAAQRGRLTATPLIEQGTSVVTGLKLVECIVGGTAWPATTPRAALPEELRAWWRPVFLAVHGIEHMSTERSMPKVASRPEGLTVSSWSMYGEVTAVEAKLVRLFAEAHPNNSIKLTIDSPGGNAAAAVDAYRALLRHPRRVDVEIEGEASSGAAIIALAGDSRRIACGGSIMLHDPFFPNPSTDPQQRRAQGQALQRVGDQLLGIVVARTGQPRGMVDRWFAHETTFTSREACRWGLCTGVL